jgi:hypothetical protein
MMHCPSCGQQQVSLDIKFCSRCGFPMAHVAEVLTGGGVIPQLLNAGRKKKFFVKKNGVFLSLMLVFVCWFLLTPLCAIADFEEGAAFFGILGFFLGIFGIASSLFFLPSANEFRPAQQGDIYQGQMPPLPHRNAVPLPPQQSIPVDQYVQPGQWRTPDTGQFDQPASVTDSTTKLLQRDTE